MNSSMNKAKINKNDEFYTTYEDIEREMEFYTDSFKDKVVYCNTDSKYSNFVKYFKDNFWLLGLKGLIYSNISGEACIFKGADKETRLAIDGDFRSEDSVELLKQSDIVVSNPPFSLFREYVDQLMAFDKEFLIIGNFNAITYKDIFPLVIEEKVFIGNTNPKRFIEPSGKVRTFGNIAWYTNIPTKKAIRNELELSSKYYGNEEKYPKYNDYNIINVDKIKEIPIDYKGIMGVPITILQKNYKEKFKVLGLANSARWIGHECITIIGERKVYNRVLIQSKQDGGGFYGF